MLWFLALILFFVAVFYGVKYYLFSNDGYWPKKRVPFVKSEDVGTFWERITFQQPLHELDVRIYKKIKSLDKDAKFGGYMEFRRPVVMVVDLDLIRLVTVKDFDHFVDRRQFGRKDDPTNIHKMLFAMDGVEWKNLRSALSPTFTTGKIRGVFEIFNDSYKKMAGFIRDETQNGTRREIDLRDALGRYTMDVIASAAFGVDSQNFKDKNSMFAQMGNLFQNHFVGIKGAFQTLISFLSPELYNLLGFTFLDPVSNKFFGEVIISTMKRREASGERRNDFLQLLIDAKNGALKGGDEPDLDEFGREVKSSGGQSQKNGKIVWSEDLLIAQCVVFIFGGFDSIEGLLMFTAYELALNPDVQEKLFEEIDEAFKKHGELTYDVVNELDYLDMVISESLRKHPPGPRTERRCTKNYIVPGTTQEIEKDTVVAISIWGIHHDPELYPDPERFIPERFSKEEKSNRHPYAYIPFGVGPRICIANRYAITEGKASIANLVHDFVLRRSPKTTIPMQYTTSFSLKPINGMWLNVVPRVK